jgi:succinoglycan biosynthesis transport protein ExoP
VNEEHVLVSLRQYLSALQRRRSVLAATVVVALVTATLYNALTRPVYEATAQILIERELPEVSSSDQDVITGRSIGADYLNTQYHLLRGKALTERVVKRLNLESSAEFAKGPIMSPWERLWRRLAPASVKVEEEEEAKVGPAVGVFRSRITVEPVPGSNLVNLRFRAYDPVLAAHSANTLAQEYIEQSLEFRYTASSETTGWISEQVEDQRRKVEAAEKALQEYREREKLLNLEERKQLVEQKLTTLMGAAMTARTERITQQTLYVQMKNLSPERLGAFPLLIANPTVQSIRTQLAELQREHSRLAENLGDKHPDMVRVRTEMRALEDKLGSETQNIIRSVESAYRTAAEQEVNLQANLDAVRQEAFDLQRKSIEDNVLKRQLDSHQQLYTTLVNRSREGGLEKELKATNIRIVEKAEIPQGPVSPLRARNYQLALGLGVLAGVLLILAAEQLDSTIKTPDDIKQNVDLPFLGVVAEVTQRRTSPGPGAVASPLILKQPRSALADAYRVIRTNLMYSSASSAGRVVAVSSVNPGEGKSTTVINLAVTLIQTGARVLVVDADLRRPTLHTHLSVTSAPGLSDALVNGTPPLDLIRKAAGTGIDVLVCGYISPNPAELLGSDALRELLGAVRQSYDWVLVDTPPILGMADTPVVARVVDGILLVISSESTTRQSLKRAVDQLTGVGAKVLGVILNRVDMDRHSYYYGQHYGEYYRSYYAAPQEAVGREAGPRPKTPPARRA